MKLPIIKVVMSERISAKDRPKITSSRDAESILRPLYESEMELRECSWAIILNRTNRVLGAHLISVGTVAYTVMDVRSMAQACLLANGTSIVISHNHPSGDLTPSESDRAATKRIKNSLEFLNLSLLDHIILTYDGYYSFADNGEL